MNAFYQTAIEQLKNISSAQIENALSTFISDNNDEIRFLKSDRTTAKLEIMKRWKQINEGKA